MLDLIKFFKDNPNPSDSALHEWAESQGLDPSEVEEQVYALATALVQFLHDGKAVKDGLTEDTVDKDQLEAGIEVEYEHTSNPMMAKRIALDHLAEIPDYYTRLLQMEDEAKKGKE